MILSHIWNLDNFIERDNSQDAPALMSLYISFTGELYTLIKRGAIVYYRSMGSPEPQM